MAKGEPTPAASESVQPLTDAGLPWRGPVGFGLLVFVGGMGPDIAPSRYFPDLDHYIPRYILLALAIGFGLSAVRSGRRQDRVLGIAVLAVGGYLVVCIVRWCLHHGGW